MIKGNNETIWLQKNVQVSDESFEVKLWGTFKNLDAMQAKLAKTF